MPENPQGTMKDREGTLPIVRSNVDLVLGLVDHVLLHVYTESSPEILLSSDARATLGLVPSSLTLWLSRRPRSSFTSDPRQRLTVIAVLH